MFLFLQSITTRIVKYGIPLLETVECYINTNSDLHFLLFFKLEVLEKNSENK
jgi:hypothetical protein